MWLLPGSWTKLCHLKCKWLDFLSFTSLCVNHFFALSGSEGSQYGSFFKGSLDTVKSMGTRGETCVNVPSATLADQSGEKRTNGQFLRPTSTVQAAFCSCHHAQGPYWKRSLVRNHQFHSPLVPAAQSHSQGQQWSVQRLLEPQSAWLPGTWLEYRFR